MRLARSRRSVWKVRITSAKPLARVDRRHAFEREALRRVEQHHAVPGLDPELAFRAAFRCSRRSRAEHYFFATTTLTFSPASTATLILTGLVPSLTGLVQVVSAVGQAQAR